MSDPTKPHGQLTFTLEEAHLAARKAARGAAEAANERAAELAQRAAAETKLTDEIKAADAELATLVADDHTPA